MNCLIFFVLIAASGTINQETMNRLTHCKQYFYVCCFNNKSIINRSSSLCFTVLWLHLFAVKNITVRYIFTRT